MIPIKLKPGVRLRGMSVQALFIIIAAGPVWEMHGAPALIITSVTDGRHSDGSYHHSGDGVDLRTRNLPGEIELAAIDLRDALGADFDVVVERTHIHVEYEG